MKLLYVTFVWLVFLDALSHNQIKAVHFAALPESTSKVLEIKLDSETTLEAFKQYSDGLIQADLKIAKMLGWTDLHLAALWGLEDEVERLIKQNISSDESNNIVNVQDKNGQTPLHLAAARGKIASIKALLKHWADPNKQDKHGWTPLHVAYFHMHSVNHPSIKLLTEGWAFSTIKNHAGKTPPEIRPLINEHSWR